MRLQPGVEFGLIFFTIEEVHQFNAPARVCFVGLECKSDRVKDILALEQAPDAHRLDQVIKQKAKEMKQAAKDLPFELAAILRDEITILEREVKKQDTSTRLPDAEVKKMHARRHRHGGAC